MGKSVSKKDKHLLYSGADIFVSPGDNIQETFGLAVAEALAYGLPPVVSDWDGYRDLVTDGETGFLVRSVFPTDWGASSWLIARVRCWRKTY